MAAEFDSVNWIHTSSVLDHVDDEEDIIWVCYGPESPLIKDWLEQCIRNVTVLDTLAEVRLAASEAKNTSVVLICNCENDDPDWIELEEMVRETPTLTLGHMTLMGQPTNL